MRVALKILFPGSLDSPGARERFELEARIAARTSSPHIVKVFDAGIDRDADYAYLAMELLTGMDVRALVAARGPLDGATTLALLRQVAEGLDSAHGYVGESGKREPIVHRDLKPANIFVSDPNGPAPFIRILDFGIAKILATSHVSTDLRGTPLYMSPEQIVGRAVSPQTDVWALGLIAFYMLTGKAYWRTAHMETANLIMLLDEIKGSERPPASLRVKELALEGPVPLEFDGFLEKCLDADPSRRFASAGEALRALESALVDGVSLRTTAKGVAFDATEKKEARSGGVSATERSLAPVQSAPAPSAKSSRVALQVGAAVVALGIAAFVVARLSRAPEPELGSTPSGANPSPPPREAPVEARPPTPVVVPETAVTLSEPSASSAVPPASARVTAKAASPIRKGKTPAGTASPAAPPKNPSAPPQPAQKDAFDLR
jgi:serine/threonine-protein kinase